jgi:hypothetical protein
MKTNTLTLLVFAVIFPVNAVIAQTSLVGPGTSYSNIFSPSASVTYDVPGGGFITITVNDGSTTQSSGIWDLTAQGGANASIIGLGLLESAAQTQLTGSALEFNISNDNNSLLGLVGGGSIHYAWQGQAFFDTPGSQIDFTPLTRYHVSFDVDGSNGLLSTVAGLTPSFSFELLDGAGNPLTTVNNNSQVNIAGLLGTGVTSGTVALDYDVAGGAPSGPMGIRFIGDATVGASALTLGTNFATVSNLSITAVPEPGSGFLVGAIGVVVVLRRRRTKALA